jgi:hypothetical protein
MCLSSVYSSISKVFVYRAYHYAKSSFLVHLISQLQMVALFIFRQIHIERFHTE